MTRKSPDDLKVHLGLLDKAYSESKMDRQKLHQVEWDSNDVGSLLGEVEILTDTVVGIADSSMRRTLKLEDACRYIEVLKESSLFDAAVFAKWIANCGDDFPDYLRYANAMETLRNATLSFLVEKIKQIK